MGALCVLGWEETSLRVGGRVRYNTTEGSAQGSGLVFSLIGPSNDPVSAEVVQDTAENTVTFTTYQKAQLEAITEVCNLSLIANQFKTKPDMAVFTFTTKTFEPLMVLLSCQSTTADKDLLYYPQAKLLAIQALSIMLQNTDIYNVFSKLGEA
jgi:hypothetical protein